MLWLMPIPGGYKVLTISSVDAPEEADNVIDIATATKDELRAWLKQNGVSFFNGASEEQLRELVLETMAQ